MLKYRCVQTELLTVFAVNADNITDRVLDGKLRRRFHGKELKRFVLNVNGLVMSFSGHFCFLWKAKCKAVSAGAYPATTSNSDGKLLIFV